MQNRNLILADVMLFGLISFVAALFALSDLGANTALISTIICYVAMVLMVLSFVVKRTTARKG